MKHLIFLMAASFLLGCSSVTRQEKTVAPSEHSSIATLLDRVPPIENPLHGEEDYVPTDLYDAINHLKKLLQPEQVQKMKNGDPSDMALYHSGLGMWMRNNWGLWAGSALSDWFNLVEIYHADDMSGIILDVLWRDLNEQNLRLQDEIDFYKAYWQEVEEDSRQE